MRIFLSLAAWLALLLAPAAASAGAFEDDVLRELNRLRANPQAFARELRRTQIAQARYGDDYGGGLRQDDPDAVEEAIDVLMRQPPLPPLDHDSRLAAAARSHVRAQGPGGGLGHGAFRDRLRSSGVWAGMTAEGVSYGQVTPRDVVRQLVVDSGVPSRGHRHDILSRGYQAAGVACGPHARWGSMCVIDYAGAIMKR
jgi:uncharacterized protein YkwD